MFRARWIVKETSLGLVFVMLYLQTLVLDPCINLTFAQLAFSSEAALEHGLASLLKIYNLALTDVCQSSQKFCR